MSRLSGRQRIEEAIVVATGRHADWDARHGSCWVLRPPKHPASVPRNVPPTSVLVVAGAKMARLVCPTRVA